MPKPMSNSSHYIFELFPMNFLDFSRFYCCLSVLCSAKNSMQSLVCVCVCVCVCEGGGGGGGGGVLV